MTALDAALARELATLRVGRYRRLSRDPRQLRVDMPEQTRTTDLILERLEEDGPVSLREYRDNDKSAHNRGVKRPDFELLVEDINAGRLDVIVAYDQDRFARRLSSWLQILEACQDNGVRIITHTSGEIDVDNPSDVMQSQIKGATDEYASSHNSGRIREKVVTMLESGKQGGILPFGWTREYQFDGGSGRAVGYKDSVNPAEAAIVREITERVIAGDAIMRIARDLNERGIRTRKDKPFSAISVRDMAKRPMNAGHLYRKGEYFGPSQAPALVSETDWRLVCMILEDPARVSAKVGPKPRHLLSGVAECFECGRPLRVKKSYHGKPGYACARGHVFRGLEDLDAYVRDVVTARLSLEDPSEIFASSKDEDVTAVLAELRTLELEQEDLEAKALTMSNAGYTKHWNRIQASYADAKSRLERAKDSKLAVIVDVMGPNAAARFDALTLDRKRAVIRTLARVRAKSAGKGVHNPRATADNVVFEWKAE